MGSGTGDAIQEPSAGARLRSYRERQGWSTSELARRLEVGADEVAAWESGTRAPPAVVRLGLERLYAEPASVDLATAADQGHDHFRFTLNSAGIYAFTYDVADDRVWRVGTMKDRFALPAEGSAAAFVDRVHPADRDRLLSEQFCPPAQATSPYRLQTVDGEWRWLQDIVTGTSPAGSEAAGRLFGITLDVTDRILAEEAARESEKRLSLALDAGQLSIWDWDLRTGEVVCTDLHFRLAGYEPDEVTPSYDAFVSRIHPADWPAVEAELERSRRTGTTYGCDFRFVHPDGHEVHVEARGVYGYDDQGEAIRLVGTLRDVSEQRANEARQRLLIREVDHRAKNMLAVISAMISLSATDKSDVPGFVDTVQRRLRAMGRAHDLIASSRWLGAEVGLIAASELEPFTSAGGTAVEMRGEPVSLAPPGSLALAMVVHELTTNAAKHGALSVSGGRVSLSWTRTEEGDLEITWVESGGPPVTVPGGQGFGSHLIGHGMASVIGGESELTFDPDGVRCRITMPRSQVVRPTAGGGSAAEPPTVSEPAVNEPAPAPAVRPRIRALLVEDDFLIALNAQAMLERIGCEVIGPVASIDQALDLTRDPAFDIAILDVKVGEQEVFPLADGLEARGIPFAFATGYGRPALGRSGMEHRPILAKPYDEARLRETVEELIGQRLSGAG